MTAAAPSRLGRRALSKAAALAAPAAADAQSPQTTPGRRSSANETGRKESTMSAGGLSKARLARMHDVMGGHVASGRVPGLVTLVSRRGETHVDAVGMKAASGNDPMRR